LNQREIVVVANTSTTFTFVGQVIIDATLHTCPSNLAVLFNNLPGTMACPVTTTGQAEIQESDGSLSSGPARVVSVRLAPMQAMVLG
jgi:hypothetical protein